MFMKDRLYLGYLEKPGVLEVISYNERGPFRVSDSLRLP